MSTTVKIGIDLSGFSKGMKDFKRQMNQLTTDTRAVGDTLIGIGTGMTKAITAPLVGFAAASIAAAADFEYSMSKVETTVNGASGNMERLEDMARRWGRESIFNASQVAEAMSKMGLAGLETEDIYYALGATIALAQSSGMDLADATGRVTSVLNMFGLEGTEATRVADIMTSANKTTDASIQDIQNTLQNASSAIDRYGISLEEAMVFTTLLADANQTGARAGTAMRAMFDDLAQACRNNNEAMQALGVAFHDMDGNARPTMDVIRDLRGAFDGMSDAQRDAKLESMGITQTAMPALIAMLEACEDRLDYLVDRFDDVSGAAQHYADIMGDNLKSELKIFWNNIRDIGIEIGQVFLPVIRDVIQTVTELARDFAENLTPEMAATIVQIGLAAAAFGPLIIMVGKAIKIFGQIKGVWKLFKAGKLAFLVPIAKVIAVVAALIAIWTLFGDDLTRIWETHIQPVINRVIEIVKDALAPAFEAGMELIRTVVSGAFELIQRIWESILRPVFEAITGNLEGPMMAVFAFVMDSIGKKVRIAFELIQALWENVLMPVFHFIIDLIEHILLPIFQFVFETISSVVSIAFEEIRGFWESTLQPVFERIMNFIDNTLRPLFERVFEAISRTVSTVFEAIGGFWTSTLQPVFQAIGTFIQNVLLNKYRTTFDMISGVVRTVFELIGRLWTGTLRPIFEGLRTFLTGVFQGSWRTAFNGIRTIVRGVMDGLVAIVKAPINAIIRLINSFIRGLNRIQIPDWVPGVGGRGLNIPEIPTLARGGKNITRGSFIAGEAGAELITMSAAGARVTPLSGSERSGGIGAALGQSNQREILEAIQSLANRVPQIVMDREVVGRLLADPVQFNQNLNAFRNRVFGGGQ